MSAKFILPFFLAFIFGHILFAQDSTSKFYKEANGTIGSRTHVNAIAFSTQNVTEPFFKALRKRFSKPKNEGEFLRYNGYNKNWSKYKIIIRVSSSVDTELNNSKSNSVFIFVETVNKYDLLKPQRKSYKKVVKYFLTLFNMTIKNGKSDDFD